MDSKFVNQKDSWNWSGQPTYITVLIFKNWWKVSRTVFIVTSRENRACDSIVIVKKEINKYSCMHTYIHTQIHTYTYIHTYIQKHRHTYIHTYISAYVQTYIFTHIHKHIRTYKHKYTNTYIHTYTYQARRLGGFGPPPPPPPPPLGAEVRLGKTDSQFVEQVVVTLEWC